jgi:hypothetical protein
MKNRQRRVRAIELSLTPQQVVMVWLRDAVQAGTFEEGSRHSPPYRGVIANEVFCSVRNAMKGQPEPQVERAVIQARREADVLFNLVVNVNLEVMENGKQREREYAFLFGYLSAEMHGKAPKDRVQRLRLAVLMFLESVITMDVYGIRTRRFQHTRRQPPTESIVGSGCTQCRTTKKDETKKGETVGPRLPSTPPAEDAEKFAQGHR